MNMIEDSALNNALADLADQHQFVSIAGNYLIPCDCCNRVFWSREKLVTGVCQFCELVVEARDILETWPARERTTGEIVNLLAEISSFEGLPEATLRQIAKAV